ncbi:MAG: leucyl/phenylalanyl-tRNA--protein transferase [Candidatus Saccharibacteria bacterium]|nr:leucyl/phenylalanyl-tRNA--protein transferase [Moraxellaceae bacterium]
MTLRLPQTRWHFPDPIQADPLGEGLVAVGADLAPETILAAYERGIFPWFSGNDPICWWSPEPRCVILPETFKPSKTLIRNIKKNQYTFTINQNFAAVMQACADARAHAEGTWISDDIISGYCGLHAVGLAHSIEVWESREQEKPLLVGGLYGVQLGRAFFGESMFSKRTDVSKMAFTFLMKLCAASHFPFVDCQLPNNHLMSLGAITMPRKQFLTSLKNVLLQPAPNWKLLQNHHFNGSELLTEGLFSGFIEA